MACASWLHDVDVILLLCSLFILHTAETNLQCVSVEILCSLWDFEKCLLTKQRKIFPTFMGIALLDGALNQIIFRVLFFNFCCWFLVHSELTLNPFFFRESLYSPEPRKIYFGLAELFNHKQYSHEVTLSSYEVCLQ